MFKDRGTGFHLYIVIAAKLFLASKTPSQPERRETASALEVDAAHPGATSHGPEAPTGTEAKQTCLVRACRAKPSLEHSSLVDFCLKMLLGRESQAWSQSKAAVPGFGQGAEAWCSAVLLPVFL